MLVRLNRSHHKPLTMHEIVTRSMKCVTATRLRLLDMTAAGAVWGVMPHSTTPHVQSGIRDNTEAARLFSNRVCTPIVRRNALTYQLRLAISSLTQKKRASGLLTGSATIAKQDHCPQRYKH
jgi:hypothetical protein